MTVKMDHLQNLAWRGAVYTLENGGKMANQLVQDLPLIGIATAVTYVAAPLIIPAVSEFLNDKIKTPVVEESRINNSILPYTKFVFLAGSICSLARIVNQILYPNKTYYHLISRAVSCAGFSLIGAYCLKLHNNVSIVPQILISLSMNAFLCLRPSPR